MQKFSDRTRKSTPTLRSTTSALSSLDRIQLMMELEQRTGAAIDESQFAGARTVGDLARVQPAVDDEPFEFPEWNRTRPARWLRRSRVARLDPAAARACSRGSKSEGLENLRDLEAPVIFASNHQSHFDVPADISGAAREVAIPRRPRHGEGILRRPLSSRALIRFTSVSPTA